MRSVEARSAPPAGALWAGTPGTLLAMLVTGALAVGVAKSLLGPAARALIGVGLLHAGLLATALGWAAHGTGWTARSAQAGTVVLLAGATAATLVDDRGRALYLGVAAWLLALATQGRLEALGVRAARPVWLLGGLGIGLTLGAHLLITASLTSSYRLRDDDVAPWVLAVAYDVGANVPSSELFFTGAVFNRLQRRASFAVAASTAIGLRVVRYLADPLLPARVEVAVGTALYVALLGLGSAWLLWRSGSVVPGLGASAAFFAAYRGIEMP